MPAYVVVDASIAGAWSFAEPSSAQAQTVLSAIAAQRVIAIAPDRFAQEMLRLCQKKTLPLPARPLVTPTDAWERFLDAVTSPIVFLPSDELHEQAWRLAMQIGITTHDALYLALAYRWDAELWTLDATLAIKGKQVTPKVFDLALKAFPH